MYYCDQIRVIFLIRQPNLIIAEIKAEQKIVNEKQKTHKNLPKQNL